MILESRIQNSDSNEFGQFDRDGFLIVPALLPEHECDALAAELSPLFDRQRAAAKSKIGGVRNLLRDSLAVAQAATSTTLISMLETLTGQRHFPVRAIFFDKTAEANWLVPWHQDLAVAVVERVETPGFGGWSVKDGVLHVHPPTEILENMVTIRLHLDDCNLSNGALKVIAGSHTAGILVDDKIARWKRHDCTICEVPKGGALFMRPLLMHASSPAANPAHRRVLHIEYAAAELPNGLKWFDLR